MTGFGDLPNPIRHIVGEYTNIGDLVAVRCVAGDLPGLQWLHQSFAFAPADARKRNFVRQACTGGCLPILEYLCDSMGQTVLDIEHLQTACFWGHLDTLRYIHVKMVNTVCWIDGLAERRLAAVLACNYGHLNVVRYMHVEMGMTVDDLMARDNKPINLRPSHLSILEYLHIAFGLETKDAANMLYSACSAVTGESLALVTYLHTCMEVDIAQAVATQEVWPMKAAVLNGNIDVVKYLQKAAGVTYELVSFNREQPWLKVMGEHGPAETTHYPWRRVERKWRSGRTEILVYRLDETELNILESFYYYNRVEEGMRHLNFA
jgi:hypothetical protein